MSDVRLALWRVALRRWHAQNEWRIMALQKIALGYIDTDRVVAWEQERCV